MATAKGYGQITLIDLQDSLQFSVTPMSSLPLSVIYDPNQNNFNPDWGTNNLVLTPSCYYGNNQLGMDETGLSITWQRQEGVGQPTTLTDNEVVDNGRLTINANKFTTSISMITYIVTATYHEPNSGADLVAKGQITFSLIKMASNVKNCTITGDNVFKYNTDGTLVSSEYVTLTGTTSNVTISQWEYKNSSGNFVKFPITTGHNSTVVGNTLRVYANENVFVNDKAVIRLKTTDANVYDLITIVKLRDGAAGSNNVSVVLTNESQMIPCDSNGNYDESSLDTAYTTIKIYDGGIEQTGTDWSVVATPTNVAGTWNAQTKTYKVTAITSDIGYIDFTCSNDDYNGTIIKRFTLTKIKTGANGVSPKVYSLDISSIVINRAEDGTLTPNTFTLSAREYEGNDVRPYNGRFKTYIDDLDQTQYVSHDDESSKELSMSDYANASKIRVELYSSGGSTLYDSETIVIVDDGKKGANGDKGDKGDSAVSILLSNYADTIGVDNDFKTTSEIIIQIPYKAYQGTTRIPCTCTAGKIGSISGVVTSSTASSDGLVKYTIPRGTTIGSSNSLTGTVALTFVATIGSTTVRSTEYYTYTVSPLAKNGETPLVFRLHAPVNEFSYGVNSLDINAYVTAYLDSGITDVTSQSTYQWYKFDPTSISATSDGYVLMQGKTGSTLTVNAESVETYASYKCKATYGTKEAIEYCYLRDRADPLQIDLISTVGQQLKNGQGVGVIYPRVTLSGNEIDELPTSINFVQSKPSTLVKDAYYCYINETAKEAKIYKATRSGAFNDSYWTEQTFSWEATYTWVFRNSSGNIISDSDTTTPRPKPMVGGRMLYVDGDLVNQKVVIDIEVSV